jgi:hypothetical protein
MKAACGGFGNLFVIPGRVENANPESRGNNFWIPDQALRACPE